MGLSTLLLNLKYKHTAICWLCYFILLLKKRKLLHFTTNIKVNRRNYIFKSQYIIFNAIWDFFIVIIFGLVKHNGGFIA